MNATLIVPVILYLAGLLIEHAVERTQPQPEMRRVSPGLYEWRLPTPSRIACARMLKAAAILIGLADIVIGHRMQ